MRGARRALAALALLACAAARPPIAALPGAPALPAELSAKLSAALAAKGDAYQPRTQHLRADGSPTYTNRLLLEASPYLQQHAHNPVNWFPWGDEAFETARKLGRPVLVSIGYSTCHWCHVMEEESFDQADIAKLLNAHFIAIKVDRESRPDIDAVYMSAIHAMGERGGWPLNVWVTPDRKPFYAGTYFPPSDRGGRRAFPSVLQTIHEQWQKEPERFEEFASELSEAIAASLQGDVATETRIPGPEVLKRAASYYESQADEEWGGLKQRIKFPSTVPVRFLLRYHRRSGDVDALRVATRSLEKMAAGGIFDHLGGGFHRYSTDPRWLVPHFEKMLYDNALLAVAYLEAGQSTGRADFTRVCREILDYVAREMTSPKGGFYSATDADSRTPSGESEEGWFYTWTLAEVDAALSKETAAAFKAWYGVTGDGDYEGRNILHAWRSAEQVAAELEISEASLQTRLADAKAQLYALRSKRPAPLRDHKILASWNGLMISAFAQAGLILDEADYVKRAQTAAEFMLTSMRDGKRLRRVFLEDRADVSAFLEDYAFVIAGLLDLFEASAQPRWLRDAIELQAELDSRYADETGGGYFSSANDQEHLIAREKPGSDGAVPSGNSIAVMNLLRLADFTGRDDYRNRAALAFSAFSEKLSTRPEELSELLPALDYQLDTQLEVVIVKPPTGGDPEPLLTTLRKRYVPNRILAVVREGPELEDIARLVPLVSGKLARGGEVTAYVCENRVCRFPTSDPEVFAKQLDSFVELE